MLNVCFPVAFSATSKFLNLVNGSLFIFGPNMFFFCEKLRCLAILYVFYCLGTPTQSLGGFHGGHMAARWMRGCWKVKQGFCRYCNTFNTCLGPSGNFSTVQFVSLNRVAQWILGVWKLWEFKSSTYLLVLVFVGDFLFTDFTWITIKNPSSREYTGFFRTSTSKLSRSLFGLMIAFYICIIWMTLQDCEMVHLKMAPWNSRWEWPQSSVRRKGSRRPDPACSQYHEEYEVSNPACHRCFLRPAAWGQYNQETNTPADKKHILQDGPLFTAAKEYTTKFNIAPKDRQSQKETSLPSIILRGYVKFRRCMGVGSLWVIDQGASSESIVPLA